MPTYEYRCTKGHTFEAFQSIKDEPLTKCEVCGRPVVRVLHSPAVHFKGSGFYNTDYGTRKRSREKDESAKESKDSKDSKDSKSTSSPDSSSSSNGSAPKSDTASSKTATA